MADFLVLAKLLSLNTKTRVYNMFNKKKKSEEPIMDEQLEAQDTADEQAEPVIELSAEEKLQEENTVLNDKYLRLFAEFDNYKRRTQKERIELLQTAGKDVVVSMLPVLDDFDRALKATENATEANAIREGIMLVQAKLKSILTQKGLKEMESLHTVFDTDIHEAITKIPASTDAV